jgi:hypothetical protein
VDVRILGPLEVVGSDGRRVDHRNYINLVAGCHQQAGCFERHHGAVAFAAQEERTAGLPLQDKRRAIGGDLLDRGWSRLPGIDGNNWVIGTEKIDHSPHRRVAADEVPIEEVQGRLIATGTELKDRRRWRPRLHGDFWGKSPDCFCPEEDRFRYGMADEPLDLDEHFHR